MNGIDLFGRRWFSFNTRDLAIMAFLIVVGGVFQALWANVLFQSQIFGGLTGYVASFGFNIVAFIALYFVRKSGAALVVKMLASIVELLAGNPFGPVAILYSFMEGAGIEIAFAVFGNLSFKTILIGSLLAWIFAGPVDVIRDQVPMTLSALLAYFGPGFVGKITSSVLCFLFLQALPVVGLKPPADQVVVRR